MLHFSFGVAYKVHSIHIYESNQNSTLFSQDYQPVRKVAWKPETYETSSSLTLLKTSFQASKIKVKKNGQHERARNLIGL